MMRTMEQLANILVTCGLASSDTIRPCSPSEVAEVSADHGLPRLPAQYEEFLRVMGRQAGDLLVGTDFFFPGILSLNESGRQLLEECNASRLLPSGSIIIGMHQGYQLYWLSPSGEISLFTEGEQEIGRRWPTLFMCLTFYAEALAKARRVSSSAT